MPSSPSPSPSSSFRLLIPTPTRLTSVVRLSRARLSPGWLTNHRSSTPSTLALIHQPASKKPTIRSSTDSRAVVDLSLISAGVLSLGLTIVWLKRSTGSGKVSSSRDDDQLGFIRPTNSLNSDNSSTSQFEIPISSHTGSPAGKKILTMLSSDQVDKLLKKYENSFKLDRVGNPVYRYDTNHVASNSPIEDDCICALVSRDQLGVPTPRSVAEGGDMLFFGVFDGHSGWQTSKLLVQRLVQAVNRELSSVFLGEPEYMAAYLAKEIINSPPGKYPAKGDHHPLLQQTMIEKIWGYLTLNNSNSSRRSALVNYLDQDDDLVKLAIQNAFIRLDEEIVSRPIEMLKTYEAQIKSGDGKPLPRSYGSELTPRQTESLQALLPSLSGSCALLAYIDTLRSKVHVACTGDSRAVMGVWEPEDNWGRGKWKALVLSEDQEGTNPNEVKRMQSEHPIDESENVIRRGRVLGGLQPTRAFGDARYKWPVGISERLYEAFHPSGRARPDPSDYRTPPYVTAKPEVSSVPLPDQKVTDRPAFLVLATDGLWDRLDTAEVVGLVGRWLEESLQPKGDDLQSSDKIFKNGDDKKIVLKKEQVSGESRVKIVRSFVGSGADDTKPIAHDPSMGSAGGDKSFIFEDDNVATHLIRNALGGSSREKVGALLSIPAPHSRRYRDDITVTVIFIDPKKVKTDDSSKDSGNSRDSLRGKLEKGLMKNVDVRDQIRSKL
ncbi:phosphatase 2C-like domain-containing protein [Phakopsora pachyrhizi]|nr:phosphatase 2C-like domain-containing protein [Phakopsora pachyrhizi]